MGAKDRRDGAHSRGIDVRDVRLCGWLATWAWGGREAIERKYRLTKGEGGFRELMVKEEGKGRGIEGLKGDKKQRRNQRGRNKRYTRDIIIGIRGWRRRGH